MDPVIVGITGGIGSGKSTVCALWKRWGARVFDSDAVAKRLMTEDGVLRAAIRDLFGPESYLADGSLNRAHIAANVFEDDEALAQLNALVHPRVFSAFRLFVEQAVAQGARLVVRESALMPEGPARADLDRVVVVDAPLEQRLRRAVARGMTEEQARARMRHQRSDAAFRAAGDLVIENSGTLEQLEREARRVFDTLTGMNTTSEARFEPIAPRTDGKAWPELHPELPRWGNGLMRTFGRLVLGMLGFRFAGNFPPHRKFVLIGAPHTTNWDFVLGMALLFALGLRVNWIGKHTIFRWPFRRFMRWMGGVPVDRNEPGGIVEQAAAAIRTADRMIVGLSPEGTRKLTERWKTGFYRIAVSAEVPIVLGMIDFARRELRIETVFFPSGDLESDMALIQERYRGVEGKYPENFNVR
ncbi:MAG: dephospho-CoA kinase [Rhodothermales bacterium]|nr:dephospho-CoA kinase [Rhodothermales bacterium]MBO6778964.1 dephospho-CoA kinase [Rhodothermales bacterium]